MQQKNGTNNLEVISMEEYLTKRQKIREKEQKKEQKKVGKINPLWILAELYI